MSFSALTKDFAPRQQPPFPKAQPLFLVMFVFPGDFAHLSDWGVIKLTCSYISLFALIFLPLHLFSELKETMLFPEVKETRQSEERSLDLEGMSSPMRVTENFHQDKTDTWLELSGQVCFTCLFSEFPTSEPPQENRRPLPASLETSPPESWVPCRNVFRELNGTCWFPCHVWLAPSFLFLWWF